MPYNGRNNLNRKHLSRKPVAEEVPAGYLIALQIAVPINHP